MKLSNPALLRLALSFATLSIALCAAPRIARAQQHPEIKFIQDTMVVEAEGSYASDPDVATLSFQIQ